MFSQKNLTADITTQRNFLSKKIDLDNFFLGKEIPKLVLSVGQFRSYLTADRNHYLFSGNRFVTSGTERRCYLWRRSVHQTTRPASTARPDPLWGQLCRDFSTLRDRRRSCGCRGITGACKDACPESPKDPYHKKASQISSEWKRPTNLHRKNCRLLLQGLRRALTRDEDSARECDRSFEINGVEDPSETPLGWRIRSPATMFGRRSQTPLATVNCDRIWEIIIRR